MVANRQWAAGEVLTVRHQWRDSVWHAHPAVVVEDTPDRLVLFEPAGSIRQWSNFNFDTGTIDPPVPKRRHTTDALLILKPNVAHAVSLFWQEVGGPFLCWYIDIQDPYRRVTDGIVTWDRTLDVVAAPSLEWRWKDVDQLVRSVELEWMTHEEAAFVRAEGERVVRLIEGRAAPFNEDWPCWRPSPTWPIPELVANWATPA